MIQENTKEKGAAKLARIPIKVQSEPKLPLPNWIRIKIPTNVTPDHTRTTARKYGLHTVCEEASCPNLLECFSHGIATFMIMGDKCTRRCSFCDVAHGRPNPLDPLEPKNLAEAVKAMQLKYVVITSVDRDDLRDGGAEHFVQCIREVRAKNSDIKVEILVPDFRGRLDKALDILIQAPSDIFNHNIETSERLYKQARPGSDYKHSLILLREHKNRLPHIPTKSGMMLGLGETDEEVEQVLVDLRAHEVEMLTLGQYLQPSPHHLPVARYVPPQQFEHFKQLATKMGFAQVASGPLVRSSYHADKQARGESVS